jgi:CBS domain-containing protein
MMIHHLVRAKGAAVHTVAPGATVGEAVSVMAAARVGALVVSTTGNDITGVISERDVVRGLADHGAAVLALPVTALMTAEVHTCAPAETVDHVMAIMTERRIRHVPVTEGGVMVGIVSIGDVVKHRIGELEDERSALTDYITSGR